MRILALTSGAANMYCGSCLRDNALAAELIAQGHDVMLVPTYTPTLTDEPNVSQEKVFFGGISVYLEQYSAIFRHTPALAGSFVGYQLGDQTRLAPFNRCRAATTRRHDSLNAAR